MIKVYAVLLALGVIALVVVIFVGTLSPLRGEGSDQGRGSGVWKTTLAAVLGFGMGGMSAEFSPLGLTWQVSLVVALLAAAASVLWVRYSLQRIGA